MRPFFHFDIELDSAAILPVMTKVVMILHSIQLRHPGQMALSFPGLIKGDNRHPGKVLRVFSETANHLIFSANSLKGKAGLESVLNCSQVIEVPKYFEGPWTEYRRVRVPNKKSRLIDARINKLEHVESLPYLRMASKSNGQGFSLHIDAIPSVKPLQCVPDSYGLSVASRPFALPSF